MDIRKKFREELRNVPFSGYAEYMDYVFACVNVRLADYIQGLMGKYDAGQGNYKNILYPDIEIAYDLCNDRIRQFVDPVPEETDPEAFDEENSRNRSWIRNWQSFSAPSARRMIIWMQKSIHRKNCWTWKKCFPLWTQDWR